ncbi:ATP-dependent zinc metalloprotease FtsH [Formosimonas limnophila]|uniref:ATP-dependent zinc metalloprotease FtsH n=1 Tax=Formosimonas limnophila TaxID=1384487 RepID=A0A8J3CIZ4_9BURK|nr:ATP-dependent zinc metalloprotease FtsH [Formosimonas limnophila]GHA77951.1 ATP-dependent zinc metalloprotease FtsH [Formosimonas limnophila]
MKNNGLVRIAFWVLGLMLVYSVFQGIETSRKPKVEPVSYSEFMTAAQSSKIKEVQIQGNELMVTPVEGSPYKLVAPPDDQMVKTLLAANVKVVAKEVEGQSFLQQLFFSLLPLLLIGGLLFFMMRQMQGGKNGVMSVGRSRARLQDESAKSVTFSDVAGCDEAKEEVKEIVDFLKDPQKFQKLGGSIPHGVLLVGPPGTGKTLLAKAIAGEARVPFFSVSGSDFVEMFVGVGASRVRDMFEQAKKQAPCIIFVDEIDAVGRHRGSGTGGGNDEREQTLNQMLVEMDGFEGDSGVIVIAATNRADVLDKALLRPGRFDRQVYVGLPDIRGREQILGVHVRKVPLAKDIDLSVLARGTPGFSGADLANLVNEAALFAARRNKRLVEMIDFEDAKDKLYMGPERRSTVMREEERRATAYHESGHAVVAALLPNADPVHKVTIMPRGWALGVTWQLPEHDRYSKYAHNILEEITILFGGRAAEEIFLGARSTGASNDFERATALARDMVARYGMTDALGPMVYIDNDNGPTGMSFNRSVSEDTQQRVDAEIRRILDEQYALAMHLLRTHYEKVEAMTAALMEWETIDSDQVKDIMAGFPPRPPKEVSVDAVPAPHDDAPPPVVTPEVVVADAVAAPPVTPVASPNNGADGNKPPLF